MPATLLQLVAQGTQNIPINDDPEISYFQTEFKRVTNFAMESIEQTFHGQADFGRHVTAPISRSGDLVYRIILQVTLPEINQSLNPNGPVYARWLDYIGEQMIAMVELEIGGQRIERHYGDFMHIWCQLTMPEEQKRSYFKMIGHTTQLTYLTDPSFANVNGPCANNGGPSQVCAPRNALPETTLYIPLQFWFCKLPHLALPLIAIQFHELKIHIDFRPIGECLFAVSTLTDTSGNNVSVRNCYQQSLVAASLYVEYIFLDVNERRDFAHSNHEYLIDQLQFTGDESVGSMSNKINLSLNHPTTALYWVIQPDSHVDYCGSLNSNSILYKLLGAQPFNYTDALDALPNSIAAFGGQNATSEVISNNMFQMPGAVDIQSSANNYTWNNSSNPYVSMNEPDGNVHAGETSGVSDAGTFVLAETALDMHCWGENPMVVGKIQLNGQDRISEREGSYFDTVQPFFHHTRAPDTGINMYSFALNAEIHQPNGSCNFSRIDTSTLHLVLSANTVAGTGTAKVRIYGKSTNFFRVSGGLGGVAFSS